MFIFLEFGFFKGEFNGGFLGVYIGILELGWVGEERLG